MSEEVEEKVREIRKNRTSQTFVNSFLLVGLLCFGFAMVLFYVDTKDDKQAVKVVLTEAQDALKVTCDIAEKQQALPANTRGTCTVAQRNELPQRVAEAIDDPDPNDPDPNDPEVQDLDPNDPEVQESEIQDPEIADPEMNDPEADDPEIQDEEVQEPEVQEPEIQEPEEQNYPVCPAGFTQEPFVYDPTPDTPDSGDERVWILCMEVK